MGHRVIRCRNDTRRDALKRASRINRGKHCALHTVYETVCSSRTSAHTFSPAGRHSSPLLFVSTFRKRSLLSFSFASKAGHFSVHAVSAIVCWNCAANFRRFEFLLRNSSLLLPLKPKALQRKRATFESIESLTCGIALSLSLSLSLPTCGRLVFTGHNEQYLLGSRHC